MSDPLDKPNLLSAFDLGPAWARDKTQPEKKYQDHRGDDRGGDRRGRGGGGRSGAGAGRGAGFGERRDGGQNRGAGGGRDRGGQRSRDGGDRSPRELPDPAVGVKVMLVPAREAVALLVKEIRSVARVYSLYDVAQILLGARERFVLEIAATENRPGLFRSKLDDSLFETKEEAVAHFWSSDALTQFYDEDDTETDPPAGNFQVVAKCGLSGEWLGPPNFHAYQTNLRRLHREQFPNLRFETYAGKVRTERGEEAVAAWLETMKKRKRWRPKGADDDAWTFDRTDMERDFSLRLFDQAFDQTHQTTLPGDISPTQISVSLMAAIRIAGGHTRRHPATLIPTICRMLEAEHLSIFKRQGKLFSGPARPHPLATDAVLSERPQAIIDWLDSHPDGKLIELWEAMLPADATETPREWLVDLFWLLTQGHVLLFADDKLVLPKRRAAGTADGQPKKQAKGSGSKHPQTGDEAQSKPGKRKRKKRRKSRRAQVKSHAKPIRRISKMNPGAIKTLKGSDKIWARRLIKRNKVKSLSRMERGPRWRYY